MTTKIASRLAPARVAVLLALLLAGCQSVAPTPSPTAPPPPPTTAIPTASPTAALPPTASPAATPGPTPTPTAAPTPTPSPTASPTPGGPPTPPASPQGDYAAALQAELDRQRAAYGMPGLGAAVLFADGTLWSAGSGFAKLEPATASSGDTPYVVGSISKTFVAATIMQLAEEGHLDLDDRLSRWMPGYPGASGISLRQLLSHTSGVFNYFEHRTYNRLVFGTPRRNWSPQEILDTFRAPPYFAPGTGYHYSNTGFILLGMVIEAVTGTTLGVEYQRRFFDPLGMTDSFFQGEGPPPPRAAHGYLVGPSGPRLITDGTDYRPTTSAATVAWATGGIVASATDLATWANALYGGELLAADSLAAMTDFAANTYARGSYGLGTRTRLIDGRQVVGHTGSLRGFAAAMWHFPAEEVTIVVLSNRGRVDVNPIAERLAAVALRAAGHLP